METFTCHICHKSYKSTTKLKRHLLIHSPEKPFKCSCGAEFHRNDQLTRHSKVHDKPEKVPKVYECNECQKVFKSNQNLKKHLMTHFELSVQCPRCKDFIPQQSLKQHIRMHNLQCHYCQKSFATKRSLDYHLKIHTNTQQLYDCPDCLKVFYTRFALKNHQNVVHKGVRKFACSSCGARFGYKSVLVKHEKICNQGKPESSMKNNNSNLAKKLTGCESEKPRMHECYFSGCQHKSLRAYDLQRHISAVHCNDKLDE